MKKLLLTLVALVPLFSVSGFGAYVTNNPVADSYVLSGLPPWNFGTSTNIAVKSHDDFSTVTRNGFMKFSLSGVGLIGPATLRFYAKSDTAPRDIGIYEVADTNWTETGINWTNQPSMGSAIIEGGLPTSWDWYDVDVGAYVRARQSAGATFVSFGFHCPDSGNPIITVLSRESDSPPALILGPNISITEPTNGSTVSAPGIRIIATTEDSDNSITNVSFHAGGTLLGNITSKTNGAHLCIATLVGGQHTLTAIAYDNSGLMATSSVSVTVVNVVDLNTNGVPDLLEDVALPAPVPFANSPFIVTGVFEAEQFDAGGPGVAYENVVAHPTNTYRVTGMWITNCDDLGRGYELRLKAYEWAVYTFKVQLTGQYVVSLRAKGASNGQCQLWFEDPNGGVSSFNAPPLSGSNWENLQVVVNLTNGYNKLWIMGLIEAGGLAAAINYISIYPYVPPQTFPSLTVTMGQTVPFTNWVANTGTNFYLARTNSLTLQAAIDYVLAAGGGTIEFLAGTYYLGQQLTNLAETPANNWLNYAVEVVHFIGPKPHGDRFASNIRFRGTNASTTTNATTLIAHNRTTALFTFPNYWGSTVWTSTNITFENLTLRGNPHIRPNGTFEPGWHVNIGWTNANTTNYNCDGSVKTNDWVLTHGEWQDQKSGQLISLPFAKNAIITHCDFINSQVPLAMYGCANVLFRSNSVLMVNADSETNLLFARYLTNGTIVSKEPWYPLPGNDGWTFNSPTPGPSVYAWVSTNIVFLNNYYDGNPGHRPNTNGEICLSDGFVFQHGGGNGNWFLGDNEIIRYGIEGVYFHAGPNGAAGNKFYTEREASNGAFVVSGDGGIGISGDPVFDLTSSMVGNSFINVRVPLYGRPGPSLVFCGNYISNSTALNVSNAPWCQGDGMVAGFHEAEYANFSGNTATNSGIALTSWYAPSARNLFVLANDFGDIHRTPLSEAGSPYWWAGNQGGAIMIQHPDADARHTTNAIIARTILGERETGYLNLPAHFSTRTADAPFVYLLRNAYRDTNGAGAALKLDPSTAPVKIY